jgi:hypothetical protein
MSDERSSDDSMIEMMRRCDCETAKLIRQRAFDECAEIARSHRGKAAAYRKDRGWKLSGLCPETQLDVQAEERGGDIVAIEIYTAIQKAKLSSSVEAAQSPESLSGKNKARIVTGEENQCTCGAPKGYRNHSIHCPANPDYSKI